MSGGWIGVDLDGTIAKYESWKGPEHVGEPIPLMVERVREWLARGIDVRIFTARVSNDPGDVARKAIQRWCELHVGAALPVTCCKDYAMVELWDDRAVQVIPNTGVCIADELEAERSARLAPGPSHSPDCALNDLSSEPRVCDCRRRG